MRCLEQWQTDSKRYSEAMANAIAKRWRCDGIGRGIVMGISYLTHLGMHRRLADARVRVDACEVES